MEKDKKEEWSDKYHKELLIEQRKHLWLPDTIEKLAKWFRLKHGMTVVDVGCGLGYLGYLYWQYFSKGGCYIGVDISQSLMKDAGKEARTWAKGGKAYFYAGDVFKLPIPDNCADCVMCQTLLIQLKEPKKALSEMIRVTKPGGLIVCKEPNTFSELFPLGYSSLPEASIEEKLLGIKIAFIQHKGKKKLGKGDFSIGNKVPILMDELGLLDIGVRINDKVNLLLPPYKGGIQQTRIKRMKKWMKDKELLETWRKKTEEVFIAGGGDPEDFKRYIERGECVRKIYKKQIENEELKICSVPIIYISKGRKPISRKVAKM